MKRPFLVAVLLGLALNLGLWAALGTRDGGDTAAHIGYAAFFAEHGRFAPGGAAFPIYFAVLAACGRFLGAYRAIVPLQIVLNVLALSALYVEWRAWAAPAAWWVDVAALGLIVLNPFVAFWNVYVLSEALYGALLAVVVAALARWRRTGDPRGLVIGIGATLVAWLFRSNAVGLLLPVTIVVCAFVWRASAHRVPLAIGLIAISVASGVAVVVAQQTFQPDLAVTRTRPGDLLARGVVVWGDDAGNLAMPPAPPMATGGWRDFVTFVRAHPWASTRVFARRVLSEALRYRPFWSARQNLVSLMMMVGAWTMVAVAAVRRREAFVGIGLTVIAYHFAVVALMFSDWDGRLLSQVLPIVMAVAALGLASARPPGRMA